MSTSSSAANAEPTFPSSTISFTSINVDVEDDPRRHRSTRMRTAADVSCTRCGTHLGFKWVVVPDETMAVQAGRFILFLRSLLFWDGSRILYAHNLCPVED
ncbi:Protein yippee-like [Actinidia chinensis var. chinensis]|uniref:Protein yippee-like n=1 Tax=Actinidia chinensis var. chinensis TaxID=1590841 RepID=A0A2R6P899_ACTCC|nr:Protein yippee-like [Actinidia chinensis var. chinensis]